MRVVAGSARGRRLVAPTGRDVRPTLDRVREAVFNALGSLDAVAHAAVLDLFAGSGALGIEALSRGAARATFVDLSTESLTAVRANLAATGLADRAEVLRGDALALLATGDPRIVGPFDLVLVDPPYESTDWDGVLGLLPSLTADGGVVVAESNRSLGAHLDSLPMLDAAILRERRYGGTVVTMLSIHANTADRSGRDGGRGMDPR